MLRSTDKKVLQTCMILKHHINVLGKNKVFLACTMKEYRRGLDIAPLIINHGTR